MNTDIMLSVIRHILGDPSTMMNFLLSSKELYVTFRSSSLVQADVLAAIYDRRINELIDVIAQVGTADILKNLFQNYELGAELTTNGTLLCKAASCGNMDIVETLCARFNADVHARRELALKVAANNGHAHIVDMLVSRFGADVHVDDERPLMWAAMSGHADIFEMLVTKFGADVHAYGDCVLRLAAADGHAGVIRFLITRCGLDTFSPYYRDFAVRAATENGHATVAEMLAT
jgi:ankyrin repeat protein